MSVCLSLSLCVCVCVCTCTCVYMHTHGVQKRASDPLGLELQVIVSWPTWVLGCFVEYQGILIPEKSFQSSKQSWKRKAGGLTLPDFNIYCTATVIHIVWPWHRDKSGRVYGRAQSSEINLRVSGQGSVQKKKDVGIGLSRFLSEQSIHHASVRICVWIPGSCVKQIP